MEKQKKMQRGRGYYQHPRNVNRRGREPIVVEDRRGKEPIVEDLREKLNRMKLEKEKVKDTEGHLFKF